MRDEEVRGQRPSDPIANVLEDFQSDGGDVQTVLGVGFTLQHAHMCTYAYIHLMVSSLL